MDFLNDLIMKNIKIKAVKEVIFYLPLSLIDN